MQEHGHPIAHILDNSGFVFPSNENKVNRDSSSNDAKANSCLFRSNNHGDDSNEDGEEDVDNGEDEVDLDRPLPVWLLPPKPGNAEDSKANGDPSCEAGIIYQSINV